MNPALTFAAWLVFAVASPADASQTMTAIPFASFSDCEKRHERKLSEMLTAAEIVGPDRRPITIKPYCTTVVPAFWVAPREVW
jgi:hypothetical protein